MGLDLDNVHIFEDRADGSKATICKNPYKLFQSGGEPNIFLQGGVFYYEDGIPLADQKDLPSYVKQALPKDYFDEKSKGNGQDTAASLTDAEVEAEAIKRGLISGGLPRGEGEEPTVVSEQEEMHAKMAAEGRKPCDLCSGYFKNVGVHKRAKHPEVKKQE